MATWTFPTRLNYVTSHFNPNRRHPVLGYVMPHEGTDYRAPTGTSIYAAHAGTVTRSTYGLRSGHYVRVQYDGTGVWTGYSHLSKRLVTVGQHVECGEVIGLSGATGSVTAAHLHFEVRVNDVAWDPVPWLASRVGAELVDNPANPPQKDLPRVPDAHLPDDLEDELSAEDVKALHDHIDRAIAYFDERMTADRNALAMRMDQHARDRSDETRGVIDALAGLPHAIWNWTVERTTNGVTALVPVWAELHHTKTKAADLQEKVGRILGLLGGK